MKKSKLIIVCSSLIGLLFIGLCYAQNPISPTPGWSPKKPITWIVPYSPGGGYDTYSRALSIYMKKYLGTEVVVKNIPGTGGARGTVFLQKAKPDGLTIGILDIAGCITQQMVMKTQYNLKKFTWLGQCDVAEWVIAVAANSPFHSVEDLQKAAVAKPLKLAVTGVPSSGMLVALVACQAMGIPMTHVPGYKGSVEAIIGVMRGDAHLISCPITTLLPLLKAGDVRPIVQFPSKRSQFLPNTKTVVELGYPELQNLTGDLRIIAGPPDIPDARANVLKEALMKSLNDPGLIEWSQKAERPIIPASGDEAKTNVIAMSETYQKYEKSIKQYFDVK